MLLWRCSCNNWLHKSGLIRAHSLLLLDSTRSLPFLCLAFQFSTPSFHSRARRVAQLAQESRMHQLVNRRLTMVNKPLIYQYQQEDRGESSKHGQPTKVMASRSTHVCTPVTHSACLTLPPSLSNRPTPFIPLWLCPGPSVCL